MTGFFKKENCLQKDLKSIYIYIIYFVDLDCLGKGSSYTLDYDTCLFCLWPHSVSIPSNWCCWSDLCILKVFDWKPNYLRSGLSLRLPNAQCLPKFSSRQPWFSLSVRKNGMPCNNKNLTILMVKWVVIFSPSYVCHGRNILDRAFWEKLPGLFSVLSFQLSRYPIGLQIFFFLCYLHTGYVHSNSPKTCPWIYKIQL